MPFVGYYLYRLLAGDHPSPRTPDRVLRRRLLRRHRRRRGHRRRALRHPAVPRAHGERAGALRAVPARRRRAGDGARAPALLRPDRGAGHHGRARRAGAHAAGAAGGAAGGPAAALALGRPRPAAAPDAAGRARAGHGVGRVERRAAEDRPRLRAGQPREARRHVERGHARLRDAGGRQLASSATSSPASSGSCSSSACPGGRRRSSRAAAARTTAPRTPAPAPLRRAAPTAGARWRARPPTPSPRSVTDVLENEELAARPGLLQRLDPRVKLVTLVLFAVAVSLVHSIWALAAFVARDRGPGRGVPGARALLRAQGLALGRAAGPPHRPAVRALLVHSRARGRLRSAPSRSPRPACSASPRW